MNLFLFVVGYAGFLALTAVGAAVLFVTFWMLLVEPIVNRIGEWKRSRTRVEPTLHALSNDDSISTEKLDTIALDAYMDKNPESKVAGKTASKVTKSKTPTKAAA